MNYGYAELSGQNLDLKLANKDNVAEQLTFKVKNLYFREIDAQCRIMFITISIAFGKKSPLFYLILPPHLTPLKERFYLCKQKNNTSLLSNF